MIATDVGDGCSPQAARYRRTLTTPSPRFISLLSDLSLLDSRSDRLAVSSDCTRRSGYDVGAPVFCFFATCEGRVGSLHALAPRGSCGYLSWVGGETHATVAECVVRAERGRVRGETGKGRGLPLRKSGGRRMTLGPRSPACLLLRRVEKGGPRLPPCVQRQPPGRSDKAR